MIEKIKPKAHAVIVTINNMKNKPTSTLFNQKKLSKMIIPRMDSKIIIRFPICLDFSDISMVEKTKILFSILY